MTSDSAQGLTASRIELFSNFLERACALMAHATSYQETLERVGALVVPLFADWCAIDLVEADGRWRRRLLQQDDPGKTPLQQTIFRDFVPDGTTPHPIMRTVATGKAELVPVITPEWIDERTRDPRHAELLRQTEVHSALFLPLHVQEGLLGVLSMYASEPSRPSYDDDDLRFGELLATVVAAALRNVDYLTSAAIELAERRRVEGELRQSLEREAARLGELRAIMDAVPAAVWIANDTACRSVDANAEARRMIRAGPSANTSLTAPEGERPTNFRIRSNGREVPPAELPLQRAAREGRVIRDAELEIVFDDGTSVFTVISCVPLFDDHGAPRGAVGASLDITRLKLTEAELRTHRENLERMVQDRTRALEESHTRLRESERMAMIGTLSAGLGHDMGNLLLPLRLRLDTLNGMNLPPSAKADLDGIATAVRYLQRLTSGLRLLARDPDGRAQDQELTRLGPWWEDVETLMKDALAPGIALRAAFDDRLPAVAVPQAALTQIVLNLIQNAGHALTGRAGAEIRVAAEVGPERDDIRITVADNGPGMDDETRRRCFEPFFSTKRRQLSTGLGLAVVRGLVERAGGTIAVDSVPGQGATFTVTLALGRTRAVPAPVTRRAAVTVQDPRARALVSSVLAHAEFEVTTTAPDDDDRIRIWVTDASSDRVDEFLARDPSRLAIVVGAGATARANGRIKALDSVAKVGALRTLVDEWEAAERAGDSDSERTEVNP
jgi:signal transduction histidine kinase